MVYSLLSVLLTCVAAGKDIWTFNYANQGYDFDKAIPPDGFEGVNRCGEPEN